MNLRTTLILGGLATFALLEACKPMLMMPDATDAQRASAMTDSATLEQLQSSHKLYVSKCGSCHFLHLPAEFDSLKWQAVIPEMASKAKLTAAEQQQILTYLVVMSTKKKSK